MSPTGTDADVSKFSPTPMDTSSAANSLQLATLAVGYSLGFGTLTVGKAIKQTRRSNHPLRSPYIYMIWGEIVANILIGAFGYFNFEGDAATATLALSMIAWVFETQLAVQIIISRIAVIAEIQETIVRIRWATFIYISIINVAVLCIFTPAHMEPPVSDTFVIVNYYWDKIAKCLIAAIDVALNVYFIRCVRQRLVKYYGLRKYEPLVDYNAKLMVISVSMDFLLVGMMFAENPQLYIQFHPIVYLVKLNIEMSMANLIYKLARPQY